MADGGLAMEDSPKIKWTEGKGLITKEQRFLPIKLQSPTTDESTTDRHSSIINLKKLLDDRDELWREHEHSQFALLEREHERLLRGLHQEIEQLQRKCGDMTFELANAMTIAETIPEEAKSKGTPSLQSQKPDSTITNLQTELRAAKNELTNLRRSNERIDQKIATIERRFNDQENRFRDESDKKNKKLKEYGNELNQKTAVVTQVMTQLHQLRLREAVEKQKRQFGGQPILASTLNHPAQIGNLFDAHYPLRKPMAPLRTSILPPIFTSTTSSMVNNIEKPDPKSFRSASFRRNFHEKFEKP